MESQAQFDFSQFQEALTPGRIRTFQVIAAALLGGSTVFLMIVLWLYFGMPPEEPSLNSPLGVLSLVHVFEAAAVYPAAFFVYRFCTSPKGYRFLQKQQAVRGDLQVPVVGAVFTGYIFCAAMLEGAALFGMIICLLGVMDGSMQQEPVYWLNLFSYGVFAAFILKTFPTRAKLEELFRRRFTGNQREL